LLKNRGAGAEKMIWGKAKRNRWGNLEGELNGGGEMEWGWFESSAIKN